MNYKTLMIILVLLAAAVGGYFLIKNCLQPKPLPEIQNADFEAGLSGWQSSGMIEADGYESESRLTHSGDTHETTQLLTDMPNGWVTLRAWVRSSGKQSSAGIALKNCRTEDAYATVPIVKPGVWMQIVVSTKVRGGQCTISMYSETEPEEWVSFDELTLESGQTALSVIGADISSLKKSEDMGGQYFYQDGTPGDALQIMKDAGMNYARIRVWVNSADGYHGKQQLLDMAKRLDDKGMQLLVDFHYSDTWADPGKQYKPVEWEEYDFENLKQAVYDHTYDVCSSLKKQGTPPAMMQIGNEINHGLLWPDGKNDKDWTHLAALLKEGAQAVKDCSPSTRVMLQLAEGGDNRLFRDWLDHIIAEEVPFDVIGVSYYPYWHGTLDDLQNNLDDIAVRYEKDIIVVETAYAFTEENNDYLDNIVKYQSSRGYPISIDGQYDMLEAIMNVVRAVPDGRGLGIFWWDATWTAVPGNGWEPAIATSGNAWENQALFDYEGRALPAMDLFGKP
ncbi:MAG: arabinogalactan endo-1,4-beta-galactosidase [Anaerolineaceae bacterium]|nr:arabinogalactan endo-1,4-beta-galactosidase [Anaerolineaceae bacterium]